jgi:hypothetical protein
LGLSGMISSKAPYIACLYTVDMGLWRLGSFGAFGDDIPETPIYSLSMHGNPVLFWTCDIKPNFLRGLGISRHGLVALVHIDSETVHRGMYKSMLIIFVAPDVYMPPRDYFRGPEHIQAT